MGIHDRDYERGGGYGYGDAPGYHLGKPQTMTVKLIFVTAAIYLAQLLSNDWVTITFSLGDQWFQAPWQAFQLLTYGFLHSTANLWHILVNMYGLWLFGRDVEARYGPREFLVFYLTAIVVAGVVWSLSEFATPAHSSMLGASGGVAAVMVVFAFMFPHRTMLAMFLFPMPMWVLAVLIVGADALGAMDRSGSVAYTAHLGGAAFGAAYYRFGWRLGGWLPSEWKMPRLRRGPPLRVHDPSTDPEIEDDSEVDDILRKIREHGQQSLTRRERRILEQASREYQKRRS
jgi:membrane associated rhomboid family serine protease